MRRLAQRSPRATYNGFIRDGNYDNPGGTGVKKLTLPFVGGGAQPFEIIRRPIAGEATAISGSRLANQAQIRVLLSDNRPTCTCPTGMATPPRTSRWTT